MGSLNEDATVDVLAGSEKNEWSIPNLVELDHKNGTVPVQSADAIVIGTTSAVKDKNQEDMAYAEQGETMHSSSGSERKSECYPNIQCEQVHSGDGRLTALEKKEHMEDKHTEQETGQKKKEKKAKGPNRVSRQRDVQRDSRDHGAKRKDIPVSLRSESKKEKAEHHLRRHREFIKLDEEKSRKKKHKRKRKGEQQKEHQNRKSKERPKTGVRMEHAGMTRDVSSSEEPASDPEPQHKRNKREFRSTKDLTRISTERARETDATARKSTDNVKLPLNVCKTVFVAWVLLLRMSFVQACPPMQSPQSATVGRSHTCFPISQHKDYNVNDGNVTIGGCSTLVGRGRGWVDPDHKNSYVVSFNDSHCCVTLNNLPCGRDNNISFTSTDGTDCIYDILKGLPCSPNLIDNNSGSRNVIIAVTLVVIFMIIIVLLIGFRKRVGKWIRWLFGTNRGTYDMTDQNETS
ncbi:uncharacterized protein LOC127831338 [Dreissena polymorpha]|uniref:Uncharacterized protein n=1 Tax=Dreissena polymorpha TaxID=45954 RepID=A0A9D4GUA0_DREPO|nr:uncharacterized protein LOC127831338 [Dreissena polymorpha]KAH3823554.1 hypothetical protein DPMN_125361 [Dreissena polymorpha]